MPVSDNTSDLSNYTNRMALGGSPTAPRWIDLRFLGRSPLQAGELNELQGILRRRITSIGDALLKPGAVIDGAVPSIQSGNPNFRLSHGVIYFAGAVNSVPGQTLNIPLTAKVQVGIRFRMYEITASTDIKLLDQQEGARNYQEPGAGRLVGDWVWGWRADNGELDGYDETVWQFYPIYEVDHGIIVVKTPPGVANATVDLVARYDRESNGNYIASGFVMQFIQETGGNYIYNLSAGTANIDGYKLDILTDTRLVYPVNPATTTVTGESHEVQNDVDGKYQMPLNREPLAEITFLSGIKKRTVEVVHGLAGDSDELPVASVYSIISVKQGATTYVSGTDYIVAGDNIDWSPGGAEPTPGSTYEVTFRYTHVVIDQSSGTVNDGTLEVQTGTFLVLKGLESGTPVSINYKYKLPRVDLITVTRDPLANQQDPNWRNSVISRIEGTPQRRNPAPPTVAEHQIAIAEIHLDWVSEPDVRNVSIRAVKMSDLVDMRRELNTTQAQIAELELKTDRALRDPVAKKNTFVDPLKNEDLRDLGITQTAAINFEQLLCPIAGAPYSPSDLSARQTWQSLPFILEAILEQPHNTSGMKINPYQAFDRPPAQLTLTPNVDRWEESTSVVTSGQTRIWNTGIKTGKGKITAVIGRNDVDFLVSSTTEEASFIRQRNVAFNIQNFLAGEQLTSLTFDGVNVTPAGPLTANSSGVINGSFNIPANVSTGIKTVNARGSGGFPSVASASYVGIHTITTNQLFRLTTLLIGRIDPLAQTFTLTEQRQIGAIDLKFTTKGSNTNPVFVQIRETTVGFPNQEIVAEAIIPATSILTDGNWTRATFPIPVSLSANREYAMVILTADANHALGIAELGQQWNNGGGDVGFVSQQPYTVGELLSSSNASTWTTHPTKDLAFRMLACKFTSTSRTVNYGNVAFSNTTDAVVKASVYRPDPDADVSWRLTEGFILPGNIAAQVHTLVEDQALQLTTQENGTVTVEAILTGTSKLSPIIFPEPQIALGTMATTGTYFSRAFAADSNFTITVVFEVFKPGAANCVPTVMRQVTSGGNPVIVDGVYQSEYVGLVKTAVTRLGDGWQEETYKSHPDVSDGQPGWTPPSLRGVGLDYLTRLKLALAATARDRVYVRKIRVVIK